MEFTMTESLFDSDHAFYCSEENYFRRDTTQDFPSWQSFIDAEGGLDFDMNLLFRWDWKENFLKLFWMGQRKGLYRSNRIAVRHADQPAIRAWLQPRLDHLLGLWSPLTPSAPEGTDNGKGRAAGTDPNE